MTEINPSMGFDCASINEIQCALPLSKKIIYAQPCKKAQDIKVAQALGIEKTVVDSPEEVEKLADSGWKGTTLVRLLVSDKGSKQPFGKKFGAPMEWLSSMYTVAKARNVHMSGFSFHVGSECISPNQYRTALEQCTSAAAVADTYGFPTETIDIGGGFLHHEKPFAETAAIIRKAKEAFPLSTEWIAEPGRFLAAPTHTLYTTVIGKKGVYPAPKTDQDPMYRITVDESVYGAFSNIPFDHQIPKFCLSKPEKRAVPVTIFGRTCDSGDTIANSVVLDEPEVGDVLEVPEMGAYTTVTASEFNGFPKAQCIYKLE